MAAVPLYPLTFHPILKERVWGGRRLAQLYGKELPATVPVGESWEICDRPEDVSVIANGPLAGKDLHWLIQERPEQVMGKAQLSQKRFPLLIKILDARQKLSLQVHPPAEKAAALGGEPKTELWYIAEAEPDAELFVGLRKGCTRQEFTEKIHNGSVAECFHRIPVSSGDAMFLPSGRVHALGAGMVIFEIQQNSDTTYRVFDWNRLGLDGKPRELHLDQSLESIRFDDFEPQLVRSDLTTATRSCLVDDPLFKVELAHLQEGHSLGLASGKMWIIGVVSGRLNICSAGQEVVSRGAGGFCLIASCLQGVVLLAREASSCLLVQAGQSPVL